MIKNILKSLVQGKNLKEKEAERVMEEIMEGKATSAQIASFLTALRIKGETVAEITGFARVMLEKVDTFHIERDILVDTCGTGGDNLNTFNISTVVAFVVAGAGLTVAKHGNRALSSRCGSADVLETLGMKLMLPKEKLKQALEKIGIGFLFAPCHHPAMKHALTPRQEIGIRTVFNILGPLINPLGANVRLMGVHSFSLTEPLARVLKNLGVRDAFVVWGEDGLDEISITARTRISQLRKGKIKTYYIEPKDFGIKSTSLQEISGGGRDENARILKDILAGERGPKREIVLINAAACFVAAEQARNLKEGIKIAENSIDSGKADGKLESLVEFTNS